ncbi:Hpt domain-containing protein [Formivibrio citricus]|uniref:Chemotaxis protein CheA n=1 Tax=Formivibrio citricus TaxID=83765 RepID=A0A1I5CNY0_9NEIS|nr:Cache 3/Cache 2 fusion domain-containing protein [Formivibrio citricus]SFN88668.1 Hpt domain-containing protein [Formivibrio citricus]
MPLKTKSVATKLLLSSCFSAVIVIVAIVTFIKASMIPQLTDKALETQTRTMAYALKGLYGDATQWSKDQLAKGHALESFSAGSQNVATLFLYQGGRYVRAATTLKKDDGTEATGTSLDPNSDAARSLLSGQAYSGPITLFKRPHMATYLPVIFDDGTRGAIFIGVDYTSAAPMLALARQMDYVVIGAGVLGIILLTIGLAFSIRVERAHRETEDIMRTMQEGIFLLDHDLKMGSQTSHALSGILGFDVKPGDNFLELLKPSVSPKTYDTAKEYIDLLLRHDVKEKLVASLNPLDCIEISCIRPNGGMESRFLQIRFNRVMKAEKVTHLLVTANDITRQVKLERELRESERKVQDQMGMMVHILQADPRLLQDFLVRATTSLNQLNNELRTSNPKTGITIQQLETMQREAHQLKGDASALQLDAITQSLHQLETQLQSLHDQKERKGEDLLPVAVRAKALYSEIGAIQEVIARIGQVRGLVSVEPPKPPRASGTEPPQPLVRQWHGFAQQLAERHEKQVELSYQGLDLGILAPNLREALNSMINQFIRNALVHGVETPQERKLHGKTETAHLSVYISDQGDDSVELSFRDDGRGIDPEKIRTAAVRSGRFTPELAQALSPRQLTMLIFESGLSTRETVDEDAGRGIGLDSVKAMVARMGGRIRIGTTRGEYCHFRVQLPLKTAQETTHNRNDSLEEAA